VETYIDVFINQILGTIDHIIIPWIVFERSYDLRNVAEEASNLFLKSIRA